MRDDPGLFKLARAELFARPPVLAPARWVM